MRIPSDTPTSVHNVRSGALQALGLRPGQTFTAQVLSHTPDGLTNLQVNNQQLSLALPSKAQIGIFLKFEFQSGGTKPQIAFLGEQPKTSQSPLPQSPLPQSQISNSQTTKQPLTTSPTPPPKPQTPTPQLAFTNNITQQPPTKAPIPTSNQTSPTTPTPPNTSPPPQTNITIPLPPTTKAALNLYPSQFINAKVISTNPNGQTTLQIAQQQITATIPNAPPINTNLKLQVQITGNQTSLVLNPTPPNNAQNLVTNPPKSPTTPNPQQTTTPTSPQIQNPIAQAITMAIPANIAKQDSISALFTNLAGLKTSTETINPTIIKTAQLLENTRLNFDTKIPTGETLQKAIKQSGIFLESILAQPQTTSIQQNITPIKTATNSDLKLLLLLFRSTLTKWLGEQTNPQKPNKNRPNPPIKGTPPRSNFQPQTQTPQTQSPKNLAQTLLNNTDSALSRLRLFQLTSLPESTARAQISNPQELNLELPFTYNGETNILRFQINRDGTLKDEQDENGWQMRFSMNLNKIGEVGADVAFRHKKINATIWASEKETANSLTKFLPELKETLLEKELDLGSIHVRYGAPKQKANPYPTKDNIK